MEGLAYLLGLASGSLAAGALVHRVMADRMAARLRSSAAMLAEASEERWRADALTQWAAREVRAAGDIGRQAAYVAIYQEGWRCN